jgi:antibiotic biosynthesis monooxygenase (ABM) superfamily enzyme
MLVRAAIYEGRAIEGAEERLREAINNELIPALRALPGVAEAWIFWPRPAGSSAPSIYCQMLSLFDNEEQLNAMLNSRERDDYARKRNELLTLFNGKVSHMDYIWDQR